MELDIVRSLVTVVSFATFIGIVLWAYSGRRQQQFEDAAALPFADDGDDGDQPVAACPAQPPSSFTRSAR